MIFLDANIPMYAGGAKHPLKEPCVRLLKLVDELPSRFATSAEVLQEILHRYTAIHRWSLGRNLLSDFATLLAGRVEAIYASDVLRAAELADRFANLEARDLLHAAVMQRLGIARIASTDPDFDRLPGVERLDPMLVDDWSETVAGGG